jgi:uncharacterized membrane protein
MQKVKVLLSWLGQPRSLSVPQQLLFSALFSLLLLTARILFTGHILFSFLVWNLFLAWVPYALTRRMETEHTAGKRFWFLSLVWLLFLPNSFYILTDLFHLTMDRAMPLWYDLALLLSFAWSGMLLGVRSMHAMEGLLSRRLHLRLGWLFVLPLMALNAFGIYLGRYLRFNSWDVLANPFELLQDILYLLIHPFRNRLDWTMIGCYTVLLTVIYVSVAQADKNEER